MLLLEMRLLCISPNTLLPLLFNSEKNTLFFLNVTIHIIVIVVIIHIQQSREIKYGKYYDLVLIGKYRTVFLKF